MRLATALMSGMNFLGYRCFVSQHTLGVDKRFHLFIKIKPNIQNPIPASLIAVRYSLKNTTPIGIRIIPIAAFEKIAAEPICQPARYAKMNPVSKKTIAIPSAIHGQFRCDKSSVNEDLS
jgi:hypothetical protein